MILKVTTENYDYIILMVEGFLFVCLKKRGQPEGEVRERADEYLNQFRNNQKKCCFNTLHRNQLAPKKSQIFQVKKKRLKILV